MRLPPVATRLLWVLAGWTLYATVLTQVFYVWRPETGAPRPPWRGLFQYTLVSSWLWAAFTLPIVALARRFPVTPSRAVARVAQHVLFALAVHATYVTTLWTVHPYVRRGPRPPMPESLLGLLVVDVLVYAGIVATVHAIDAQRQALRLRQDLIEAELRVLRMQLQPHFLFNTLNAVSELVHVDPARAERALARLGDLLRWSLQASALHEVSLRDELAALDHYLEIQRLRHGDGLAFHVDADADTLGLAVPSLLLQPLVENAIRHGVRGAPAGTVRIRTWRRDGRLELAVTDDGAGFGARVREGTGLRTTRARLEGLYGPDASLRLAEAPGRGTVAEVTLPARAALADREEAGP